MAGVPLPADVIPCSGVKPPDAKTVTEWYTELANLMLADPGASVMALAQAMGRSPRWVAIIKNSDTFADFYAKTEAGKIATIHDKTQSLVEIALDHLVERVETLGPVLPLKDLHDIVDKGSRRLGYDQSSHPQPSVNVNVGVTVGREELARARERMHSTFGIEVASPAPNPRVQTHHMPKFDRHAPYRDKTLAEVAELIEEDKRKATDAEIIE